jgi:hypothetical protein
MRDDRHQPRANLGYPLAQLEKALAAAGGPTSSRVTRWRQIVAGLLDGSLRVGSRTPVADAPPWVTLEVAHGGFATGNFAAAGPLQQHEIEKLSTVTHPEHATDRATLNLYFLGDSGRSELTSILNSGRFRIRVPEEGALLVAAWLIERGEGERAAALIETIMPFFDRLRFYPVPHTHPVRSGAAVSVQTAGESIRSLHAKRPQASVLRIQEAIKIWTPLYDRAVELFLETVEGDTPALRTTTSGELARAPNGQPIVDGGWPCRHYPEDWAGRAQQLLDVYQTARARHHLCGKPEKPKENFARLRGFLAACAANPSGLSGRDVGTIRKIIASYVTRHGTPGSARLKATRAVQASNAAAPPHHLIAGVVARRLERFSPDEGVPDLDSVLRPLAADEAAWIDGSAGDPLPLAIVAKARRCLEAPIPSLVQQGLVPSGEVLARVLPALTAQVRAEAVADPELRRVYQSVYVAFRWRRSLLLLDLEGQVRLGELPWISAVEPWVGSDAASREAARSTLIQAASLAIDAFPHTILPNRLVRELRALAAASGDELPLVDELAADIFMGAFSENFLRAARSAARLLRGSLYERYYGLPYERVLALDDVERERFGTPTSPGFAHLCEELAGVTADGRWSVARNGTIIEQAQILTTHNLAVLFGELGLASSMRPGLPRLARRCFRWICQRQQMVIRDWRAQLQMMKNTAYAWRQMVFYLSLANASEVANFQDWSSSQLGAQQPEFARRFEPVLAGLDAVITGETFDSAGRHAASGGRRFLGWTLTRHWLLPGEGNLGEGRE